MIDYNKLEADLREITGESCYNSNRCKNLQEISDAADAIAELQKQLEHYKTQSANRLIGICKAGNERDEALCQVAALRDVILSAISMVGHPDNIDYLEQALSTIPSQGILCEETPVGKWDWNQGKFVWLTPYKYELHHNTPLYRKKEK